MVIGGKARLPTRISKNATPPDTPFLGFILNNSHLSVKYLPKHFLRNAMNGPYAQARRIKDIGLVLPKYYGIGGNTEGKEGAELCFCRYKRASNCSQKQ